MRVPTLLAFLALTSSALGVCQQKIKPADSLRSADLIFVSADQTDFANAISAATRDEQTSYTHVGIIEIRNDSTFVLEATSKKGVTETPLQVFLADRPSIAFYRVTEPSFDPKSAIEKARTFLGEPYDYCYLPHNNKMYCSELVYESYLDAEGKPIFPSQPMNFKAQDGTYPAFWIELFKKQGMDIPQGVSGTNPNDLSKSTLLQRLDITLK